MTEPKPNQPLTKKERDQLYVAAAVHSDHAPDLLRRLFAAEAYWRGVVKNLKPEVSRPLDSVQCTLCNAGGSFMTGANHTTDCPWKLAQDA